MSISANPEESVLADAPAVHRRAIIVDGHCDTPYRLHRSGGKIADPAPEAQLDLRTLRESGITASFFASYVPGYYTGRGAADLARKLIELIDRTADEHPDRLTRGRSSADIRKAKRDDRTALMIGVEGGHAIEDSLEILTELYERGARYLTLTHVNTNNWADSSGDEPRHGGLTRFGRDVVRTMNDLGMIVDVSHVADTTFYHALETSRVPVVASHSSCRAVAPHPRNLTDAMLRDLASVDGVCMINFFSAFVEPQASEVFMASSRGSRPKGPPGPTEELPDDSKDWDEFTRWYASLGLPPGTIETVVDHMVHAASVAGVGVVGIGSDFDGVAMLPDGLETAAGLPLLTARMLERGFHENEVEQILGANFLRTFEAIEAGARR